MDRKIKTAPLTTLVIFVVLFNCSYPVPAFDVVTIIGEVNDSNQIMVDGEIYEVDDSTQGDDLVKNYIGRKVKSPGRSNSR